MTLTELQIDSFATAKAVGWHDNDTRSFGDFIALVMSELAEAFEEYRDGRSPGELYFNEENPTKPEGIPAEIADVFIRLADMCVWLGIPIESAIRAKAEYNRTRSYRHGGKVV